MAAWHARRGGSTIYHFLRENVISISTITGTATPSFVPAVNFHFLTARDGFVVQAELTIKRTLDTDFSDGSVRLDDSLQQHAAFDLRPHSVDRVSGMLLLTIPGIFTSLPGR